MANYQWNQARLTQVSNGASLVCFPLLTAAFIVHEIAASSWVSADSSLYILKTSHLIVITLKVLLKNQTVFSSAGHMSLSVVQEQTRWFFTTSWCNLCTSEPSWPHLRCPSRWNVGPLAAQRPSRRTICHWRGCPGLLLGASQSPAEVNNSRGYQGSVTESILIS